MYSDADIAKLLVDLTTLGLRRSDSSNMAVLRQIRGKLLKRTSAGVEITASGRASWIGWIELVTEAVDELATRHTAQVIADVNADVLAVIEAENRTTLRRFMDTVVVPTTGLTYPHVMCIDGNDERGIDVGLYTRPGYPIVSIGTHVDDKDAGGIVFSRDCAEYTVDTPSGERVLILVNHLKSKGYGTQASSNERRRRQAHRIAEIYRERRRSGVALVAVVGDLNDTPGSAPLAPLLSGTDLRDVSLFPGFADGGWPGTHGTANASSKIDYILASPVMFDSITEAGVIRSGCYTASGRWPMYPTLTKPEHAASDHAAIWATFAI